MSIRNIVTYNDKYISSLIIDDQCLIYLLNGQLTSIDMTNNKMAQTSHRAKIMTTSLKDIAIVSQNRKIRIITGNGSSLQCDHDIKCIKFTQDGTQLIFGTSDGALRTWIIDNAIVIDLYDFPVSISNLSCSPDGKSIVVGLENGEVKLQLNSEIIKTLYKPNVNNENIKCVAFSPDGQKVVYGIRNNLTCYDIISEKTKMFTGHIEYIKCVAFSPLGHLITTASVIGTVNVWRFDDCTLLQSFEIKGQPESVQFTQSGNYIMSVFNRVNTVNHSKICALKMEYPDSQRSTVCSCTVV